MIGMAEPPISDFQACLNGQRVAEATMKANVKPGDVVFIGSYLTSYFDKSTRPFSGNEDRARQAYLWRLLRVAESLIAKGASVVLYLNGPRFNGLEGAVEGYCFPQWYKPRLDPACQVPAASFLQPRRRDFAPLLRWADGERRILWDGADPATCGREVCQASHYKDEAHFRPYYANYLFDQLLKRTPSLFKTTQPQAPSRSGRSPA
jgi:hypothetical protein